MKSGSLFGLILFVASNLSAATVTLRSGNGSVGGTDSLVHFLDGPSSTDFASLTAASFTSAQTGPAAFIVTPNGAWLASLPADPSAKWIGTNVNGGCCSGDTALYAIGFTLPAAVLSGSITVNYATDNQLGQTNDGIFINGTGVTPAPTQGSFTSQLTYTNTNIGSLLHSGTNFLYFDAVNTGGPAGFIFSATITTVDATAGAPEPASLLLLGGALIVLGAGYRRRVRG